MSRGTHFLIGLLALFAVPATSHAATLIWPVSAGCTTTLQACVDAAFDHDRIEIATDGPIIEGVAMHARSLTLEAAAGFSPVFRGVGIIANNSGSNGDLTVRIKGLRFEDGFVTATYAGTGTAIFDLRDLVLTRAPGATGHAIQVIAYSGIVEADLYNNRIRGRPLSNNDGLIRLAADGGTLNARAFYNQVDSTASAATDGAGILVDVKAMGAQPGAGTIKLHANQVRGSFSRAGIFVSEGLFSSTPSPFDVRLYSNVVVGNGVATGIRLTPNNGTLDAQIVNNTITRVATGISVDNWDGASTPVVEGLARNNLVRANTAMFVNPGIATGLVNDYNLFNGATTNFTPGPNTITSPAGLVSDSQPRLSATSPAIDAADSSTLGFGILFNALPITDADGLRRFKRMTTGSKADIGAFEYGDLNLMHRTRPNAHMSTIDDPALNGRPDVNLFGVPNFNGAGASGLPFLQPYGFWYPSPQWSLYHQDTSIAMPDGVIFNLFAPAAGSGNIRHTTTIDSVSAFSSQIDSTDLDNQPDMIVLVAQNWSAGGVYNPHHVGVFTFGWGGDLKWHVGNLDQAPMPAGTGFSVYFQQPSPNAFRVSAPLASTAVVLDHPLLNDTPCARIMVTRMWPGSALSGGFDVFYRDDIQRWTIFNFAAVPVGTMFNVLVDPGQVAECTDRIFANGYE